MTDHRGVSEARGIGWGLFWWTLAVVAHLVFGVVLAWEPLYRWWTAGPTRAELQKTVEGPRLHRMVRDLLDVNAERLAEKVHDLDAIRAELEKIRDHKYAEIGHTAPKAEEARPEGWLEDRNVLQIYDAALELEGRMYAAYREIRAAALARIQQFSLEEARRATEVSRPPHPPVERAIFDQLITNTTDGRLDRLKQQVERVHVEVNGMITAGNRLLEMVLDLYRPQDMGWRIAYEGAYGSLFQGATGAGTYDDLEFPYDGPALMAHEYYPGSHYDTGGLRPAPGRKFMREGGQPVEWMYPDSWYYIGPFPNPGRRNLEKAFPPEKKVDLSAGYVGKDGRSLKWRFKQTSMFRLVPPMNDRYAIYYAYTEIFSDRDRHIYTAIGSDDYAKMWVNDELVYQSDRTPHAWNAVKDFRKIHFHQGYNRVLFRIENAGGLIAFSVVFYTGDVPEMGGG